MRTIERIYLDFARILPKKSVAGFQKLMTFAGMKESAEVFLGRFIMVSTMYALVAIMLPYGIYGEFRLDFVVGAFVLLFLGFMIAYMMVYFKVEKRTKAVEAVLPDTFQMIAANIRAGMTPFKALKSSSRGGDNPLDQEIEYVTSRALGTESFAENLLQISTRIKSDTLDKSMKLFTTSMRSGGKLATLLEELSADMSETTALKNEMKSSTKTYTMFILFTIICGAPLLFAISVNFVDMITGMQAKNMGSTADFGMASMMGEIAITSDFIMKISLVTIAMTSILASMLMGTINEGDAKSGLKFAVPIMLACMAIFFIANIIVGKYLLGFG